MIAPRCHRFCKLLATIVVLSNSPGIFAFDRDQISFTSRRTRTFFGSRLITRVVSSKLGPIASIVSDERRTNTDFRFQVSDSYGRDENPLEGYEQLSRLRGQLNFSDFGKPVAAGITHFDGTYYGIVWMTKQDLVSGESNHAQTIPVGIGHKLYGPILNFLPDTALLVRLGPKAEILKIYDLNEKDLKGRGTATAVSRVVEELANAELVGKLRGLPPPSCRKRLGILARLFPLSLRNRI